MISRLFGNKAKFSPSVPQGERIYAIGDIHGRADLLRPLLEKIDADDKSREPASTRIIFLGDLIDRGPASSEVVELVRDRIMIDDRCHCLLGNHEEVFLQAMSGDLKALKFFTRIGGRETILSYGISEAEYNACDYPELLALLRERVPVDHIEFLSNLEDAIIVGDYAFVHAGVRPGLPLATQKTTDLRWIRSEFLEHSGPFDKVIVHGHTIFTDIEEHEYRIGLDTGAYASGKLSAMGFSKSNRWPLQISA